jgi:hypothetical protein
MMIKMLKRVWCVLFGYVVVVQWDADWQHTHYESSFDEAMNCIRAYPVECIVEVRRHRRVVMKRGHDVKPKFVWPTWGDDMYRSWFV